MSKDKSVYTLEFEVGYEQLKFLYKTFSKSVETWSGGEWWEQLMLENIKKELWKMIMEEQFKNPTD